MNIETGLESFVLRTHLKEEWIKTMEELRESHKQHSFFLTMKTLSLIATIFIQHNKRTHSITKPGSVTIAAHIPRSLGALSKFYNSNVEMSNKQFVSKKGPRTV